MNKLSFVAVASVVVISVGGIAYLNSSGSEEDSSGVSLGSGFLSKSSDTVRTSFSDVPPEVPGSSGFSGSNDPIEVSAWSLRNEVEMLPGDIKAHVVDVDVALTEVLNTEDIVSLDLPVFEEPLVARISNTYNEAIGVQVWQGNMEYAQPVTASNGTYEGHPDDNVVIAKGKTHTHVTIATRQGTYTVIYDNKTGRGTLVDEADNIAKHAPDYNDAVTYKPAEEPLPAL